MKTFTSSIYVAAFLGFACPVLALASLPSREDCEAQARVAYKKKVVEIEMSLITGDLNEIELGDAREAVHDHWQRDRNGCVKLAASRGNAVGARAASF